MPSRHKSRQRALQILFLWEARGQTVEEAIDSYYDAIFPEVPPERDPFTAELVRGAVSHLPDLDARITRHAAHWRLERMPAVDRNIIRLAVYEMTGAGTPAAIAIDEALELARKFSGEDSVQFVNGVLDAIHRELSPPPEPPPEPPPPA
jgi:N utilization substance protein B